MNHLFKQLYHKVVFTVALGAVAASAGWSWHQRTIFRKRPARLITPIPSGPDYVAAILPGPPAASVAWSGPPAQPGGDEWLYDVFTPPLITYDPGTRSFAVTPPGIAAEPAGTEPGLELLRVKREPYRLQLAGYFGEPGDYLAAFVSPLLPDTLLARPGHCFASLGLTLKNFAVHKVLVAGAEPGPVYDVAAFAVLQDAQTGAEVVLDSRTPRFTDTPLAVFKTPGDAGRPRELREGDTFAGDDASYRIERIQLDPPEVVVARTSPDRPAPEVRVLRPIDPVAGKEPPPKPRAPKAATNVAHNEQVFPLP